MELKKLKVKSVKKLSVTKVNDLTVKDTQHYITENGVINHNTGPEYAASVILFLGKKQLTEGSGKNKDKSGIVVKIAPNKNRFAKPNTVETYIRYDSGMNPFVGLEKYVDWDICGIGKGEIDSKTGTVKLKSTGKNWAVKHLNTTVSRASDFYSDKVFTEDVLKKLDEHIKPIFNYQINNIIPDDVLSESEDEIIDLLESNEEAEESFDDLD